jgi:small-conductance mechanosensitive channel
MLFDWLRLCKILYFDKDDDAGGGAGGSQEDDSKTDDGAGGDAEKAGKKKEKATVAFTPEQQEWVNTLINQARDKEREKAKADFDAEADKARKKADAAALEKNQEWQTLAEQRATELATLTQEKVELEPFKGQADKYKKALEGILAKQKESLPKFVLPLIEKMDVVDAMEYITAHAKELGAKLETYSETPDGKEKKLTDDDTKEAKQASTTVITRTF